MACCRSFIIEAGFSSFRPGETSMEILLTAEEVRVLGCLMEKEMATPDYYPLSLNALTNACNQKSGRNPVVDYDEETVLAALNGLKERQLAWQSDASRVAKYAHGFAKVHNLVRREAAAICLLLLRGPQTAGEIRGRAERLYNFSSLEEAAETLENLADMGLVRKMPRQPGRKESRYAHLLSGEPQEVAGTETPEAATVIVRRSGDDRIAAMAEEISALKQELADLKQAFADFRKQFE